MTSSSIDRIQALTEIQTIVLPTTIPPCTIKWAIQTWFIFARVFFCVYKFSIQIMCWNSTKFFQCIQVKTICQCSSWLICTHLNLQQPSPANFKVHSKNYLDKIGPSFFKVTVSKALFKLNWADFFHLLACHETLTFSKAVPKHSQ